MNMHRIALALAALAAAVGCDNGASGPPPRPEAAPETRPAAAMVAALQRPPEPVVEPVETGEVNWTEAELLAVGMGRADRGGPQGAAMAKRAARVVAARNALAMTRNLRMGPGGRMTPTDPQSVVVQGVLRSFQVVSETYDPATGTATVTLRVPLYGQPSVADMCLIARAEHADRWQPPEGERAPATAVVIDARHTGFRPCLFPVLVTADGQTVFDLADVPPARRDRRPVAAYLAAEPDVELPLGRAKRSGGALAEPVLLRPDRCAENAPGALVLSPADVTILSKRPEALQRMAEGRCVIFVSPPASATTRTATH
jgi:hypothetical protein